MIGSSSAYNKIAISKRNPMDEWFRKMVTRMFELMHMSEHDNFDAARYSGLPENAFYFQAHADYFLFFEHHRHEFFATRCLLRDRVSQDLFDQLLLFRMLGHLHVRLPFNNPPKGNYRETINKWRVNGSGESGLSGELSLFVVPVGEEAVCMKCWPGNIAANRLFKQYYFSRDHVVVAPDAGDHAIDAGACFGDTALFFACDVGDRGHVYSFDPMPQHCEIMRENFEMNPAIAPRITLFPVGLSDHANAGNGARRYIDPGARLTEDLPARTIDSLDVPKIDFIKMDIEGSELAALKGGEQTIRRDMPKLAISLYHRPEDFFVIPEWIDSLGVGYKLHLDHYSIHHEETVLYAYV